MTQFTRGLKKEEGQATHDHFVADKNRNEWVNAVIPIDEGISRIEQLLFQKQLASTSYKNLINNLEKKIADINKLVDEAKQKSKQHDNTL